MRIIAENGTNSRSEAKEVQSPGAALVEDCGKEPQIQANAAEDSGIEAA